MFVTDSLMGRHERTLLLDSMNLFCSSGVYCRLSCHLCLAMPCCLWIRNDGTCAWACWLLRVEVCWGPEPTQRIKSKLTGTLTQWFGISYGDFMLDITFQSQEPVVSVLPLLFPSCRVLNPYALGLPHLLCPINVTNTLFMRTFTNRTLS